MKKFTIIFSTFLFLSLSMNAVTSIAQITQPKKFSEGFYNIRDLELMENISYNIQNISEYKGFFVVLDFDQKIQQVIALEPHSPKYCLKPIKNSDRIIILGNGQFIFSPQRC